MPEQIRQILFILLKAFSSVKQSLLPRIAVITDLVHNRRNLTRMIPNNQIILVLELTVKGRRRIAAVFGNVPDR